MPYKDPERNRECNRRYRETPRGRAKEIVHHFKQSDKKYGRGKCTITEDWILENIFTQPCYYCGETDWKKLGCDRINNDLPHTPENVIPCCARCNRKRRGMPFKKFVELVQKYDDITDVPSQLYESKAVIAKNDVEEVVYEFPSTAEAGRNGFEQSAVSKCCNGCFNRPGNHKYKGLYWFYK